MNVNHLWTDILHHYDEYRLYTKDYHLVVRVGLLAFRVKAVDTDTLMFTPKYLGDERHNLRCVEGQVSQEPLRRTLPGASH